MDPDNYLFYNYSNTYDACNNFLNYLHLYDISVNSALECGNHALSHKSGFFILTDLCNNDTGNSTANCYYSQLDEKTNMQVYSDSSYSNWISGLVPCTEYDCYGDLSNSNAGISNNLSVYLSPLFTYMNDISINTIPTVSTTTFNLLYNNVTDYLDTYNNYRRDYLRLFYTHIDISGDTVYDGSLNQYNGFAYDLSANEYASKLQDSMFQLNMEFQNLLIEIDKFNTAVEIRFKLVEILDLKIFYAEQFFNILMNKNQGAIGELDINEYNKFLILFKNSILTIVIITSIYLYFKKSE